MKEEEEEEEETARKEAALSRGGTKATRGEPMGNGEREARWRAHQLMEAAINNAAVVYHSDPRLILVVPRCQPAGGLVHPLVPPRRDQPTP